MEDGLLKLTGAQEVQPDKFVSLATIKFIAGLQTQRSAFASIDTRYNSKFLGGKPDALIAGQNVEISNHLTLTRRAGLLQYGVSNIPAPVFFFDWQLATTNDIILVIDTETPGGDNNAGPNGAVFNYSPTHSGIYINKAQLSTQTQFMDVVNTLYLGDGEDLYKITGPNQLAWSNTYTMQPPWVAQGITLVPGQNDPLGGTAATEIEWTGGTSLAFDGATGNAQFGVAPLPGPFNLGSLTPTGAKDLGIIFVNATNNTNSYVNQDAEGPAGWTNITGNGAAPQPAVFTLNNISGATNPAMQYIGSIFDWLGTYLLLYSNNGSGATSNVSTNGSTPSNGNNTVAFGSNVTAGHVLLCGISLASSSVPVVNTVTDSEGNTWTLLNTQHITGDDFGFNHVLAVYGTIAGSTGANTVTFNISNFTAGTGGATLVEVSGVGGSPFLLQNVTPNYSPVRTNTFTASFWAQTVSGANTVTLEIKDQSGTVIASTAIPLTSTWTKYQVTGTMLGTSTSVTWELTGPTTTNPINIWGAQLEIGGPATTTQITTTKQQGVWLWGIDSPKTAPTFTTQMAVGNTGAPWQANHTYHVGDTIVDSNGNLEYATNGGIYPEQDFAVTSVASGTGVYTGTFSNSLYSGANNGFAGLTVVIVGFTRAVNNGTFTVTASTLTTITTTNSASIAEAPGTATAKFGVVGTTAGISGGSQPTWNVQVGGFTQDGLQNLIVQTVTTSTPASGSSASVTFPVATTNGNTIVLVVYVSHPGVLAISDSQSNTYTSGLSAGHGGHIPPSSGDSRNIAISAGQFTMYLFYALNITGGTNTISVTGGGSTGTYLAAVELTDITMADDSSFNSNSTVASSSASFQTGGINTTNAKDIIFTAAAFAVSASVGSGAEIGTPPSGYTTITQDGPVSIASNSALVNITTAFESVSAVTFYDPNWSVANPTLKSQVVGVTGAFESTVGTLVWLNQGMNGAGLTTTIGYQYYYAYGNSYTGHFSNVSPISLSTGKITGQDVFVTGATRPMIDPGSIIWTPQQWTNRTPWQTDPQSDLIAVYRNTDGGGFWYQDALFGNGAAAQANLIAANYPGLTTVGVTYGTNTWTYEDTTPDTSLNTAIFAPIGLLNSLPPVGLKNLEFFQGRMWGSVNNILYYATSADNAQLLGIQENGVSAESWIPTNFIPYNAFDTKNISVGGGLLVFTTTDTWFVTGQNLLTGGWSSARVLAGHGLRSYNAATLDGSSVWCYTSDRQCLIINPNSGSVEFGFAVGDTLENTFSPLTAYLARHVAGSQDNAVFMADDLTGWYRLNPNQQGASMSGEQTPVWSPKADFTSSIGGISAIGSIETVAGTHKLLVGSPAFSISGQPVAGPVLVRDINTFSDNSIPYSWTATIGSILLATSGKIAEVESITTEMNNIASAATQCAVLVLLEEISGPFETLTNSVNDPPQINPSSSVLARRFYLAQDAGVPMCKHLQIQVSGGAVTTKDEMLAITIRGALETEQA